jgi:acyl carrier protein
MPDRVQNVAPVVLRAVFKAIDDVNELLASENQLAKSPATALVGPDTVLDSMAFVNLIAAVEERIEEMLGTTICLADQAGGINIEAFRTVGTLADYISRVLGPTRHETESSRPS